MFSVASSMDGRRTIRDSSFTALTPRLLRFQSFLFRVILVLFRVISEHDDSFRLFLSFYLFEFVVRGV